MLPELNRALTGFRRNTPAVYGFAVLFAVAALLIRLALGPILGNRGIYITFSLATAAYAALAGFWPGLTTAAAGALLAGFVLPPGGWAHLVNPTDPFGVGRYFLTAAFVCLLCELLISSRERALLAERRLRESERIYRAIGESIPFGVWICDPEGRHKYASESLLKLTGFTQADLTQFGWGKALHPADRERILQAWQQCVREQGVWDIEMRYRGIDGQDYPVLARGVPVKDDNGRILCWAGINLDIRHLKQAEAELQHQTEELKRSNRDLEQFAFVASHDMREPLRTVNIYTQMILRKIGKDRAPELEEFAGFVHDGVERMERLIQDLLALSRVIHGDIEKRPVDSNAAVQDALNLNREIAQAASAQFTVDDLPMVLAGEGHVTQVFQNLISNAIKYRKPDTSLLIRISAETRGAQALFRVSDNGIGFDPRYAEEIFRLFARLNGNKYEGAGLGLAICRRIVERYGGSIWAESKPDQGSTFCFTIPLAQQMRAHQAS